MQENRNKESTEHNGLDLNEAQEDLATQMASTHLSSTRSTLPQDDVNSKADRLLDELSNHATTNGSPPPAPLETRHTSHYDQFFEEVSLDIPRDPPPTPSKLLKFMPRRSSGYSDAKPAQSSESGPFYSISEVLSDAPSTMSSAESATAEAAAAAAAAAVAIGDPAGSWHSNVMNQNARRNGKDQDIKNGGPNVQGSQRQSSRGAPPSQKPSPLEVVVSKTRPRMLPPKDPQEEKKHLQQHKAMMKKAEKKEAKKQKENNKRKLEQDKKHKQAVYTWEHTILPHWNEKVKDKKIRALWSQGIPPRCRKRAWCLAIGNSLNLPKDSFMNCLRRIPSASRTIHHARTHPQGTPAAVRQRIANTSYSTTYELHTDEDSGSEAYSQASGSYSNLPRGRRTSSLNVLHADDDRNDSMESMGGRSSVSSSDAGSEPALQALPASDSEDQVVVHDTNSRNAMEILTEDDTDIKVADDMDAEEEEEEDLASADMAGDDDDDTTIAALKDPNAILFLNRSIDEDILRTLPSLCVFQADGPLFLSLRKVLHAYVGFRPDATYTRGASFLAGMLLLNMSSQDAFIALTNLIRKSDVLLALYSSDEQRVNGYFKIFNVLFAEKLPKLYLHFKNLSLTPDNYLPDWFMTLFTSIFPLTLSSRLWDIFLLEGDIILFKTGLIVLHYLEPLLWGGSFGETVNLLKAGFVGEHRGEEAKAALAVSSSLSQGEHDTFFNQILGKQGDHLDDTTFKELLRAHISPKQK